jgi:hypothetical protein
LCYSLGASQARPVRVFWGDEKSSPFLFVLSFNCLAGVPSARFWAARNRRPFCFSEFGEKPQA